ncbi:putative mediator of RNA polymerase II transcription subunit 19b [Capsicum galapagoense]
MLEFTGVVDLISHFKLLPHHEFFCKKPLPLSIFDTHYLHNVVGDTEIRKGKEVQLDQHTSSLKEINLCIQPFDLDALREDFRLCETAPIDQPTSEKGIPIIAENSKSESADKEKKHKKHKDKDKEHKKHKHCHKDRSKEKDKEKKKDRTGHHDSGSNLSSGWRTWRNMARPFGCFAALARDAFVQWINYPEWKSGCRDSLKMEENAESKMLRWMILD